jgi:hypothetical protein
MRRDCLAMAIAMAMIAIRAIRRTIAAASM